MRASSEWLARLMKLYVGIGLVLLGCSASLLLPVFFEEVKAERIAGSILLFIAGLMMMVITLYIQGKNYLFLRSLGLCMSVVLSYIVLLEFYPTMHGWNSLLVGGAFLMLTGFVVFLSWHFGTDNSSE